MKKNKRILIIGIGSIGKNYLHEAIKKKLECFVFDLKYSPISSQNTSYISLLDIDNKKTHSINLHTRIPPGFHTIMLNK